MENNFHKSDLKEEYKCSRGAGKTRDMYNAFSLF